MRVLGLDVGAKRIGVAVSDALGTVAQPLVTLERGEVERGARELRDLLEQYDVGRIVVGLPTSMDGREGEAATSMRAFARALEKRVEVPVATWDERLTTAIADAALIQGGVRREARKRKRDMVAATLILQSYLDHQRVGEPGP